MIGFGILGTGAIAHTHAKALREIPGAVLTGVFGTDREQAEAFAQTYGCRCYSSAQLLLADPLVHTVSICTPSGLHAEYAVQAAQAKKHFITEKPMAITAEQLDAMVTAVQENGVKGAVVVQKRFSPAVQKLKDAIDSGKLGRIFSADCAMRYYRTEEYYAQGGGWRGTWTLDGGGALMNQGIHGVDLVQYLMGGIRNVFADCRTVARQIETEDHAYLMVEYGNGALGTVHSSTVCYPGQPCTVTVCGEKGTVVLQEDVIVHWDVEGSDESNTGQTDVQAFRNPMAFSHENHKYQLQDLVKAIREDGTPVVDVYEGRKAVDIILAAYASSQSGKKVWL